MSDDRLYDIYSELHDLVGVTERIAAALERQAERETSSSTLPVAFDAAISRESVLRGMAMHLATNDDAQLVVDGGARHLAILALSRCYTLDVLEDGSCFDPYTAAAADSHEDGQE